MAPANRNSRSKIRANANLKLQTLRTGPRPQSRVTFTGSLARREPEKPPGTSTTRIIHSYGRWRRNCNAAHQTFSAKNDRKNRAGQNALPPSPCEKKMRTKLSAGGNAGLSRKRCRPKKTYRQTRRAATPTRPAHEGAARKSRGLARKSALTRVRKQRTKRIKGSEQT